jgi:ubiquinone/menaquinone biosynthesis C-methylase UbiE
MIQISKNNLGHNNNLELIVSDALSFIRNSYSTYYDMIISAFTIHNETKEYRKELYTEIYRVLNICGLFLNADKFVSDSFDMQISSFKFRISSYIEVLLQEAKYELLKEWILHYIEDIKPDKIMKLDEEINTIKKISFKDSKYLFISEKEMLAIIRAEKY